MKSDWLSPAAKPSTATNQGLKMITHEYLLQLLHYEPSTGALTRKIKTSNRVKIGDVVGCKNRDGYLVTRIGDILYYNHRLAWFYVHGDWPDEEIDHRNGVRDDNRLINLRRASRKQNARNSRKPSSNSSGVKGVSWCKIMNKWFAYVGVDNQRVKVGYFDSLDDAEKSVSCTRKNIHGQFANNG